MEFRYHNDIDQAVDNLNHDLLEGYTCLIDGKEITLESIVESYVESLDEGVITDWDCQREYSLYEDYVDGLWQEEMTDIFD